MRAEQIVGDKVLGLLGPEQLTTRHTRATPAWLRDVVEESRDAARARLRKSGLAKNPAAHAVVDAIFAQSLWSAPLVSAPAARAMWGKTALLRALPKYRLADLVIMRDKAPLDLSPLGSPTDVVGKHLPVVLRELHKPNTGLRLQSVQAYHPRVKTFATRLATIFASDVNVNGYASLSQGTIFQEHWDAHDVLLVQTHGTKVWRVRPNSMPMPIPCHRQVLRPKPRAKRTTLHLEPGTALYIPRGHWHVGEGDESIHISFGLPEDTVALRVADLALKTLARHLPDLAYRTPMFMFEPSSDGARSALVKCFDAYLNELRSALRDAEHLDARPAFFGRRFF